MSLSRAIKGSGSGAGHNLYMNDRDSDVSIEVHTNLHECRFPAHSLILGNMSEVMRNMLASDMIEKSSRIIIIEDSDPSTIKQFLKFLYTGEVNGGEWRETVELLKIAHKYQVHALVDICEKVLTQAINFNRSCYLHEIGELYSLENLVEETQKIINYSGFIVIATEGFQTLKQKSVEKIISSRLINVENELSILHALIQWGKAECSRRKLLISEQNVVDVIRPLLQFVRLNQIPERKRKLITSSYLTDRLPENDLQRVKFYVPPMLHEHMTSLKFVLELGSFVNKGASTMPEPLMCIKFSSDENLFILGFRIVGLFRNNFTFSNGNPMLVLSKDEKKGASVHFDLSSVPWKSGSASSNDTWREVVAYFPHPARVDPFCCYSLTVKYANLLPTKWPRTRVESNRVKTEMGAIAIYIFGQCAGVTELFLLPAPPRVVSCNSLNSD